MQGGYTQDMETVMETKSISSMRTSAAGSAPRTSVSASALTSDAQQALITSLRGQQPSTEPVTASLEVERLATAATAHVHAASPVQTIPRLGLAGDHFSQSPFSGVRASPAGESLYKSLKQTDQLLIQELIAC
jgi:septal ring-binding cell division protein DamX